MKKQLIGIAIATVLLLVAIASTVSAATMTVEPTTIKKGDTVVLTISTAGVDVDSITLELKYESSKFDLKKDVGTEGVQTSLTAEPTVNTERAGVINIAASSATKTTQELTITFVAKEDIPAGEAKFEVTESELMNAVTEAEATLDNTSVTVTVPAQTPPDEDDPTTDDPTTDDPTTDDPTTDDPSKDDPSKDDPSKDDPATSDPSTSDPSTSDPSTSDPSDESEAPANNETGDTIPQTGSPVFVVAIAAVVVATFALVVKKVRK